MQAVAEQSEKFEVGTTISVGVLVGTSLPQSEASSAPAARNSSRGAILSESEWAWHGLSRWSRSPAKRVLDCIFVGLAAPVVLPLMAIAALAVRFTSSGPVLFRQTRMGRAGKTFVILKFRTMEHSPDAKHHPVTTSINQRFTPVGPFLRRWKLDELPQIVNVLRGDISLVGPRPKLPEHTLSDLPCRPGVTGMATACFANEEAVLADIPKELLQEYYHSFVLPQKHQLDAKYMATATLLSDLHILLMSIMRRGKSAAFDGIALAPATEPDSKPAIRPSRRIQSSPSEHDHRSVIMEVS